ncbi:hypothetical protein FHX37_2777 [Haloactinospora alba]|uniref:Uncharacterized protein n=1 Tax=Haloactinospora alba TaxID=405555 RepID=A0A543NLW5_9ACTN|nr:hypothetical protein [Haloactinospora alba]TQN32794.1 hypothetical protein FHX37_2777 [Haloactinospora alba]
MSDNPRIAKARLVSGILGLVIAVVVVVFSVASSECDEGRYSDDHVAGSASEDDSSEDEYSLESDSDDPFEEDDRGAGSGSEDDPFEDDHSTESDSDDYDDYDDCDGSNGSTGGIFSHRGGGPGSGK